MSDFYYQSRANIISTMQCSLKQIRQVLNIGVQELADIIGVTRQTINNIENNKNKLSTVQYISICAVIDYLLEKQKISYHVIAAILASNKVIGDDNVYTEDIPILQRFFLTFADDSKLVSSPFCNMAVIGQESYMKLFQDYKVFLDDTALADENSYVFLESVKDISQNVNIQFIVPLIVIKKIEQISSSSDRYEADCAKKAKYRLKTMQSQGILQVRGEKSDKDIVNTFVSVFAKFKKINRLALITHDITLAEQISTLNNLSGFEILILKINENGTLSRWWSDNQGDVNSNTTEPENDVSDQDNIISSDSDSTVADDKDQQTYSDMEPAFRSEEQEKSEHPEEDPNDWSPDFMSVLKEWESI